MLGTLLLRLLDGLLDEAGTRPRLSAISLVAANLIPLIGVLFFGWDIFFILVLYWMENVVVGLFNVLKMCMVPGSILANIFNVPFFCIHYGMFTLVHGLFVFVMFGGKFMAQAGAHAQSDSFLLLPVVMLRPLFSHLYIAIIALLVSHSVSFATNYVKGGEYRQVELQQVMMSPYGRIVVLHLTIILGGLAVAATGAKHAAIAVLVMLKIIVDLCSHAAERKRYTEKPASFPRAELSGKGSPEPRYHRRKAARKFRAHSGK